MDLDYRPVFKFQGKTKVEKKKIYSSVNSTMPGCHFQQTLSEDHTVWMTFKPKTTVTAPTFIEI
ncbi:hypothetical protein [Jiulongibacter sp. NS-SX5]|uniref:hypothetical protein n=1 Tax=Jiulongibacter sp. NS-SX5 TaxID=3463854 RepID=UPI00405850B8